MNYHIDAQIRNMIAISKSFKESCRMAAREDDGTIDKAEEKQLSRINAATDKFIKELEKIK